MKGMRTSIHASVWGPDWSAAGIAPALRSAARIGYDHVVVPLRRFEDIEPSALALEFNRCGISPLNTCGLSADKDIGSADADIRKKGIQHLRRAVSLARDMGSTQIGGVLYGPLGKAAQPAAPDEYQRMAEAIRLVADDAGRAGVRLALEVVNRYETARLHNTGLGLAFLDMVDHDNVFLHLDTFHMSIEEADPRAAISRAMPRLAYFELDQSHRGAPDEGSLDLAAWLRHLASTGYQGIVGVEAFSRSLMAADHADSLAIWSDRFRAGDSDRLAEAFMRLIEAGFQP